MCVILNINKIIGDGGITVDIWIIKVHSFPLDQYHVCGWVLVGYLRPNQRPT